jgi:hypothetical protein
MRNVGDFFLYPTKQLKKGKRRKGEGLMAASIWL